MTTLVVAGAGGNIGSHLLPLVARLDGVRRLVLVDPDRYDRTNLATQAIRPGDVGRFKVHAQARRLGTIRPDLAVTALPLRVEDAPLGRLRGAAILGCLDGRAARRAVNRVAFRLGMPWIDGGVQGEGLLARVTVYLPAPEAPCLECGWTDDDYDLLGTAYPCTPRTPAATGAPAALGALAASLVAIETRKLLVGDPALAAGRTVLVDARHSNTTASRMPRNPRCRFDHRAWRVARRPFAALGDAVPAETTVELEGRGFFRQLVCGGCGGTRDALRLDRHVPARLRACPDCGAEMEIPGFFRESRAPLRQLTGPCGLVRGDVVTLRAGGKAAHVELS